MGIIYASGRKKNPPCVPCPHGYAPGNPGTLGEVHKKVEDLYPRCFEGVRLNVKKNLSSHFSTCHMIKISPVEPTGYTFGAYYQGDKKAAPNERYPEINGTLRPDGHLAATWIHTLGCRLRIKHITQMFNGKCLTSKSTMEYRRDDMTLSASIDDPDFLKQCGTISFYYLQAFTPRLTMGIEVSAKRSPDIIGGQQSHVAGAFRYSTGIWTLSTTIGHAGIHACYHHKASQQLQLGVELQTKLQKQDSTGTIYYRFDIPHADMIFKGYVDTTTTVAGVFEKKLYPVPGASLLLSCQYNHIQENLHVGIGLNVG